MLGLATDCSYLLAACWELPFLHGVLRQRARYRYSILAPHYDGHIAQAVDYGTPLSAALDRIAATPRRVLDVCTGTGYAAEMAARRYPEALVAACDLSFPMLSHARDRLAGRPLLCCDNYQLPFADGTFDLVILQNAPPALRELSRIAAPGGWLALGFSSAAKLPAWIPSQLVRRLHGLGFVDVDWGRAGNGLYVVAHRAVPEGFG